MKMYSEQRRLERYRVIYTWKVLQGLVPNPGLKEAPENEYLGRRCHLPKINHGRQAIQTLKEPSFQVSGPNLFNSLPKKIRNMNKCTQDEFKLELDKYLQTLPDQPKIDGLSKTHKSCLDFAFAKFSIVYYVNSPQCNIQKKIFKWS